MRRQVAAELLKLRTVRTSWWLAAVALALPALAIVLTIALSEPRTPEEVRAVLTFAGTGGTVVLILGAIGMGAEYRHRTVVPMFLAAPRRLDSILAKALVYGLAGAAIGLACAATAAVTALPWLAARGVEVSLSVGEIGLIVLGAVVYSALSGMLGVGLGALLANQVAVVVALLVVVGVIDPTISVLLPDYAKYSLSGLGIALSGGTADEGGPFQEVLSMGAAAVAYLGYAIVAVGGGALATARREIG